MVLSYCSYSRLLDCYETPFEEYTAMAENPASIRAMSQ